MYKIMIQTKLCKQQFGDLLVNDKSLPHKTWCSAEKEGREQKSIVGSKDRLYNEEP